MNDLLIVMSNPLDGRHDDFNDWYGNVHIRDVMRLPGSSAVQRLRLHDAQVPDARGIAADRTFAYLALYECHDIALVSAGHAAVFSPMMLISDSFDFAMREAYYRPLVQRRHHAADVTQGAIVVERIGREAAPDLAEWYDRERMPTLMAVPGVVAGTFSTVAPHQMLDPHADSWHIGLYRTHDPEKTLAAWGQAPVLPDDNIIRVSCYAPLMPQLTAREVIYASPEGRLAEARARLRVKGRVYTGFPEGLF